MEEELPILTKPQQTDPKTQPKTAPTQTDEGLPILKKKVNAAVSPSPDSNVSPQHGTPSKKSTPKSSDSSNFISAIKDMVKAADEPADEKPVDPLVNAVKRGLNLAEQAGLTGPFADKPDKEGIKKIAEVQKQNQQLQGSKSYQKFSGAKTFGEALNTFVRDPATIIVELTAESVSSMAKYGAPRIAAGAAIGALEAGAVGSIIPGAGTLAGVGTGAAGGALVGMADTSYGLEFTGKFLESLQEAGVDTSDPTSLEAAFQDDAVIAKARELANKKAIPIALFDLVSGGLAGKMVKKPATSLIGKVGQGAAEFGIQAAMGAGGETAGQLVAGEKIQPGAILGEALGELATTPVEVGLGLSTLKSNEGKESNVIQTGSQEEPGVQTKTEQYLEESVRGRQNKTSSIGEKENKGVDEKIGGNIKTEGTGKSVSENIGGDSLLASDDITGKEIRTSSDYGENIRETTDEKGGGTSQEQERTGQLSGQSNIDDSQRTSKVSPSDEGTNTKTEGGIAASRKVGEEAQQMQNVSYDKEPTLSEGDVHKMSKLGLQKETKTAQEVDQKSGEIIPRPSPTIPKTDPSVEGIKKTLVDAGKITEDANGLVVKQNSGYPSQLFKDLEGITGDQGQALNEYLKIKQDEGEFKKKYGDWENQIMKDFGRAGNEYTVLKPAKEGPAISAKDEKGKLVLQFNENKLRRESDFQKVKQEYAAEDDQSPEYKSLYDKTINKLRDLKLHLIHQELIRKQKGEVTVEDKMQSLNEIQRINAIPLAKDYFGEPMVFMHSGNTGIKKFLKPGDKGYVQSDIMTGSGGIYFSRSQKQGKYYSEFGKNKENEPAKGRDIYYVFLKTKNPYYMTDPRARADYELESSETISKKDIEALKAKGYDSVIWDKENSPKHEVVVFEPDQVEIIGSYREGLRGGDTSTTTPDEPTTSPKQPGQQPAGAGKPPSTSTPQPAKPDQPEGGGETPGAETGSAVLDQPLSGIKKSLVPESVVDATPVERRSMEDMLQQAKEQVDTGQVNPKAVVDEIANGNARALQPDEVAALVYYKTKLDNRANELNQQMLDDIESKDVDAQARTRAELDAVNQEIDNYQTMSVKTAYEQSLAFRLRQMLLDNEYNLQTQINKYKVANNGEISPEVENKFKELHSQLQAANAAIKKLEERQSVSASTEALQNIRQSLQRQREKRAQSAKVKKEKINAFFDSIKLKTDPNKLNSITQVIGEAVYNGSVEAVRAAVLAGADVASAIQAGIDYVQEHYRGTDFDKDAYGDILRPGLETIVPSELGAIPEVVDGKLRIPTSIITQIVESGAENINQVVMMVKDMIKDAYPEISNREIRDAITKYGETRSLSKDAINVKIREIKRIGKLISSLEDVQNRQRPLKSGLQRDKLTDEERRLQRQIKEGIKDIPVSPEEEAKAWRNALDAVKSRLRNQITDLENQIKTGESTPKKKGITYDQQALDLQKERDRLKKLIQDIEGRPKMSDEQRVRMAVTNTQKQIQELQRRIDQKDTSAKTASSTPVTSELAALRKQRDDLRKVYGEMEAELGVVEKRRLENYKKALKKSAQMYEQRIADQDFIKEKPKPLALDEEATKLKLERDKIKQQFDLEQEKARLKNRPLSEKIWDTTVDIFNLPKSFLASIDMSAPFRQGALLSVSNPKAGARSFSEMFRQAFSEKKANEWLLKLKESPEYAVMKAAKLYLAEPTTKLTAKEENFISNIAGKIPVIGAAVKGSERAYTGYLNKLRVDVFANGADQLREQGITPENNPEAYKQWANFINNATGRGNLGGLEMAAPALNALFFSPRYVASRVNLLNPVTYAKMPAPVRRMAIKSVVAYVGFGALVLTLAAAAGADVEPDPRSSDFGKIRLGDTRYDIWAGFQQIIRLMAQLITGERKSTKTGEITELSKDKFPYETRGDVGLRFLRSKLSPTAGTIANFATGENIVGEDVTVQGELVKNVVPLYLQDIQGIYEEEGPTGVIQSMVPAFFGIGVQSYGEKAGLTNKELDPASEIQQLNKARKYSISGPSKSDLTESLDHEVDDETYDKFYLLRDKEIRRQFDRYKLRLEAETDIQIYDKLMDQIVREAGRHAKYQISREKGWRETMKEFNPGDPFKLRNYKKNEEGKVVPR